MAGELREKVASGMAWSVSEKVASMLLQIAVSLVLLRMLLPGDFGVMAILTVFASVAMIVADSGFSQMLIRRADPGAEEYKSVFVFNIAASWLLYLLAVGLSCVAARFYGMPALARLAPVFFLLLPVNALCVIQQTIFTRQFRFALLSKVTFVSTVAGGAVAVGMALGGCGVWSIVGQRLAMMAVRAALLWRFSPWRPAARYDGRALRAMAPYSLNLMATDLISTLCGKIPQLFFARMYPDSVLGYFDQAQKLKDLPVTSTVQSVQNVTFPALARLGGDRAKFAEASRQLFGVVACAMFPAMVGMSVVARDLFSLLLGEKWMPIVPYFEVICFTGLFTPLAAIACNMLKARSDGRIIVRIEALKKGLMLATFAVTIPVSVMAVVWGLVFVAACELIVNFAATRRYADLTTGALLRTLLPVAVVTAVMYAAVRCVGIWFPEPSFGGLSFKIAAGVAVYGGLSLLFRLEAFRELVSIAGRRFRR